ncbi:hypothetical protein Ptr902_10778 [Pyrenophora tritici-repentis]|nr:hypothetical protein Ptr902_10778 [Pyrenophora tritici-repentis]
MSHEINTYYFSFVTTKQQIHLPTDFRAHKAVTVLNSGFNSTAETTMSNSNSMVFFPTTPFDIALVVIFVFVHISIIRLANEHDYEFGVHIAIDHSLYYEGTIALLDEYLPAYSDDSPPAYTETPDEPPAYSDVIGIDVAVFAVETEDDEDGTL